MPSQGQLDKLNDGIDVARRSFHRLVLLVGPPGSGKTASLQRLAETNNAPLLNINLELSQRMLEVPKSRRPRQADRIFKDVVSAHGGELLVLDNLEILFDPALQLDPLRLLQSVSRNQTVVASWSGALIDGLLTYAEPDHPEHRAYRNVDVVTIPIGHEAATNH